MEALKQRLAEQQGRHQGGNKWIGTGGTSPFGHGGYNPEGVRIGGPGTPRPRDQGLGEARVPRPRRRRANSAPATSRSRCAACAASPAKARPTSSTSTARSTAPRAQGWLDVHMRPERHNAVKLLLFLDIGGSMDGHVRLCRGAVLGRRDRVQASRAFLLPQLHLRGRVEGQSPPPRRADADPWTSSTNSATTISW